MIKSDEINHADSCLNRAADDEPLFILRSHDPVAPSVVRIWASLARNAHEPEKREEAFAIAMQMDKWRMNHDNCVGQLVALPGRPVS